MIDAEKAQKIMTRYESDYDNFLKGAKSKAADKQAAAAKAVDQANKANQDAAKAEKTAKEAEQHKPAHLKEKAKKLLDKVGGIQGAAQTVTNVMNYIKTPGSADYSVGVGDDEDAKKKDSKIPVELWYAIGAVAFIGVIYGLSHLSKPAYDHLGANYPNPPTPRA